MAIIKRRSPEQKFTDRMGDTYKQILATPLVKPMVNPAYNWCLPSDPASLVQMLSKFYDKNWMTKATWNEKVFLYAAGMVARRAGVPGLLPDDHMTMLARHMNALTTLDKIDKNEVPVGLYMRMALIWDIPAFMDKYKGAGSYKLPSLTPPPAPKKKFVKLEKHKLQSIAS